MTKFFLHTVLNLYKKKGHAKLCVSFDDNKAIIKLNTIMIVRMTDFEVATICHTIHFRLGIYAYIYGYELHKHLSNIVISI